MRKLQCTLTSSILLKIYNSLILPHFNYGLCSWGFHSDDLFALQKKAVRVVANRPYIAHTDPIFNKYTLIKYMTYINCNYTNYFIAYVIIFYHYTSIPFFQL